jgi:cyclohexadienyl dehydratase
MRVPQQSGRRLLVVAGLLCLMACAARRPAAIGEAPLRVGTSGDYPPFSVRAADGSFTGFDVAVAEAYATARGRRLELISFRWPELAARLAAGDFDVAMSGVTVRPDRLLVGTMTAAVARADAIVLIRGGEAAPGKLDRASVRIAVNRGGHLERVARTRLPHATLVPVDDNRRLPALLAGREVAAVVTDTLEAATFATGTFTIAARLAHDRKAYWVAPGREALAADLDAWLLERARDGTLARLRRERLGVDDRDALPPELAHVVDLVTRRLLLMPEVGAAKRAAGLPLVDGARETQVVARAVARARGAGLDRAAAEHLARAQIAAARGIQEALRPDPQPRAEDAPTLAALRAGIDALDGALLQALVTARTARPEVQRAALSAALRADADLVGFDEIHAGAISAALAEALRTGATVP